MPIGQCFANSTTGKDRIELGAVGFCQHGFAPRCGQQFCCHSREKRVHYKEVKEAVKFEGQAALKSAFESLGKLAIQELMSNPAVGAGFSGFEKYVDMKKLKKALE